MIKTNFYSICTSFCISDVVSVKLARTTFENRNAVILAGTSSDYLLGQANQSVEWI